MQTAAESSTGPEAIASSELPQTFLSCYEITNADALRWGVRLYKVRRVGAQPTHAERGEAKQAIWALYKKHKNLCKGYGFVIDVDEEIVAVPADWNLPSDVQEGEFQIAFDRALTTNPNEPSHRGLIAGILREAIKTRFKNATSATLGELWQDFDRFCQVPQFENDVDYHFCRKFGAAPKVLRGNRWVIQPLITTATLDGWTFADYFRKGEVDALIGMIEAKQANRLDRRNRPTAVRVLRSEVVSGEATYCVVELEAPNLLEGFASLSRQEQAQKAEGSIRCSRFGRPAVEVPYVELRLVLDTQITQADHSQTILEPADRNYLASALQDLLDGMEVGKVTVRLSETPVDVATLSSEIVALPTLRVRDEGRDKCNERLIPVPNPLTEANLKARAQQRQDAMKKFGFLQGHPINPLLAWPKRFGTQRASRMADDVNRQLASAGITFKFGHFLYCDVEELRRHVEKQKIDALFAVLPEGWRKPFSDESTHEKIKRRIDVPSQCIQYDHTLPEVWVGRPHADIQREDRKLARRIAQRYELCLWNLFAKLGWVPFAPADPFAYNVHIGLDVGGRHNSRAMACLGYGFTSPRKGLLFRPEEIPIDVQKAEPIPTNCLTRGLLGLFEQVHADLTATGVKPDFERTLFFRDGRLLGDGDDWNELDALKAVRGKLQERGWVGSDAVWTAVEVMKNAEEWRLMRGGSDISNPLVGQCVFPFDDESTGLVCTTGLPYLPQGTAAPLKIGVVDICGRANRGEVVRDLVWEADMCFTKPDMGMSLPWVLHVADAGALQLSRSYRINGITL
jgi:hypothetical protein